jgi:hypothetical protein
MAYLSRVGDTEIEKRIAKRQTRVSRAAPVIPRQSLGRSLTTFGPIKVPQPARTARPPVVAPEAPRISGKQGPFKNPVGDAIKAAAKKLAPLIADAFSETGPSSGAFSALGFQPSGLTNVGKGSFGADFGSVQTTPLVPGSPVSDAGALIGSMKEGGFIRKRT